MKIKLYFALLISVFLSGVAQADITTVAGEFTDPAQTDYYSFTVDTAGAVNLYTSSDAPYDPTLTLWSATSLTQDPAAWTPVAFNDNTSTLSFFESGVNPKDAQIKLDLSAGTYFEKVTNNGQLFAYQFNVDTDNVLGVGSIGTGAVINVSGVSVAAVPLPAAVWMFASGLMGFLGFSKRKAQNKAI